jgi:hypothetical protein
MDFHVGWVEACVAYAQRKTQKMPWVSLYSTQPTQARVLSQKPGLQIRKDLGTIKES